MATETPVSPTVPPPTVTTSPSPPPSASLTPTNPVRPLKVWLPPNFAPDENVPGGSILAGQIAAFEQAHPDQPIQIRLKATSGPAGLLASLSAAYNAAPAVLPNIIALNRDDLAAAARAGLVIPLDNFVSPEAVADYYPFAQTLSRVEGQFVGLPFAADARVLVYTTEVYTSPPLIWSDLVTGTLVIPGAETSALTLLNEYLALGGKLTDASGRTALSADTLAKALESFQTMQAANILPLSTLTYADPGATWQVFRERRVTLSVTSAQWYLAEYQRASNAAATWIPNASGLPFALADGWSWAIVNTAPERHTAAAQLLLWLVDPAQLAPWTQAAQVLPPRAAALTKWGTSPFSPFAGNILTHAQLLPAAEILSAVGPPLHQALDDVLNGRATPAAAALLAAQTLAKHSPVSASRASPIIGRISPRCARPLSKPWTRLPPSGAFSCRPISRTPSASTSSARAKRAGRWRKPPQKFWETD